MSTNTKKQLSSEEKKELEALRARLAELEPSENEWTPEVENENTPPEREKIPLDEYIPVMSLLPYRLNLTTKEGGQGDVKRFTKFGEVKNIMYKDLVDIIEVQRSFTEAGFFYIMSPEARRKLGLDEAYSKILTKDKIDQILTSIDSELCIDLYNTANPEQQRIIVQLFVEKIKADPNSVNLNVVDRISRLSKTDITQKAEESLALQEELLAENKQ